MASRWILSAAFVALTTVFVVLMSNTESRWAQAAMVGVFIAAITTSIIVFRLYR